VTCISEAEKYEGALYRPKSKAAKRDPQAEWTDLIAEAAQKAGSKAQGKQHAELLQRLGGYTNVPRKLKPFINFAKNSLKFHNDAVLTELFTQIHALLPKKDAAGGAGAAAAAAEAAEAGPEEGAGKGTATGAAGSKRKRDEEPEELSEEALAKQKQDKKEKKEREKEAYFAAAAAMAAEAEAAAATADDAVEADAGGDGGFDFKKHILAALKAASSTDGGRLKTKRLLKGAVDAAARAGVAEGAATAAFEARLAKLVKKGKVAVDSSGKFVVLGEA
jgi:hypothetical protein